MPAPASPGLGAVIARAAGVAIAGAIVLGLIGGFADIESAKAAILAAGLVGLATHRCARRVSAVIAAAIMSLAGAVLASLIAVCIGIAKVDHIPYGMVAAGVTKVIPLVPHVIGAFGVFCWALAALVGGVAAASGPVRPRTAASQADTSAAASEPSID